MKIVKKGKYTDKIYKCATCMCEFEIDYIDIEFGIEEWVGWKDKIIGCVRCPECANKIYLMGDDNVKNNN